LRKLVETQAEDLAAAYKARHAAVLSEVIAFVLQRQGHAWADCGRHVPDAGDDAYAGLPSLPDGDAAARTLMRLPAR
jgi:hypothetical protein